MAHLYILKEAAYCYAASQGRDYAKTFELGAKISSAGGSKAGKQPPRLAAQKRYGLT
jgi:hypothetical protein